MAKITTVEAFAELMNKYNENRAKWMTKYGSDAGFDVWFTEQVA